MLRKIYIKWSKKAILHGFNTLYKCRENEREKKMGIACFQLNIFAMTAQKSKINLQLMSISDERDAINTQLNGIIKNSTNWYKDPAVQLLQQQDDQLDNEQKNIESQLKALEASIEAFEKQKENNTKNEVPQLSL